MNGPKLIYFIYSPPGEVSERGGWLAFHECWMYGLCDTLEECARDCYEHWQQDYCLVG